MRIRSLRVSDYKNLKNFALSFDGRSHLDLFVGRNGSGKSNLFEALIQIFQHLYEFDKDPIGVGFDYDIAYEVQGESVEISWREEILAINGKVRKSVGKTPLPENMLIYYSGHNEAVRDIVQQYETSFRKRIKAASSDESRRFIGIGPECRELLLAVLLVQPAGNHARDFLLKKLDIKDLGLEKQGSTTLTPAVIRIVFDRPTYARARSFDVENNDATDRYWKPVGITKDFLDRLSRCIVQSPGGLTVKEGYFSDRDQYVLYLGLEQVRNEFSGERPIELFRQFDNLKTLGMLSTLEVPMRHSNNRMSSGSDFSDGQFQSAYILTVIEVFSDSESITLLDEPDAFLHPEWQFDFLTELSAVSGDEDGPNHVLLSSHSAPTISSMTSELLNLFEIQDQKVVVSRVSREAVIRSLSAGRITVTEGEALLSIGASLKNSIRPVVFVEGVTDEAILSTAWERLYPGTPRPFELQMAFDRIFLRNLFSRDELRKNYPGRPMFAIFDFDEAYDDWNGLKFTCIVEPNPQKGLAKQLLCRDHFAILLPVPGEPRLSSQVLSPDGSPWPRGTDCHLPIELLFFREELLGTWFQRREVSGGGAIYHFTGDKVRFAEEHVRVLDSSAFEVLRPVFDFILSRA